MKFSGRLLGLVMAVLCTAPIALAATGAAAAEATSTLTWQSLPYTPTITGAAGRAEVTVTLPAEARPVTFVGDVRSSYVDEGSIVVTINGRRVAEVPATTGGPVSAALTSADLRDGVIVVAMYADLEPRVGCFVDSTSVATLVDAAVSFAHDVEAPDTIGGFLSDGVQTLDVQVATDASSAEQQAALDAVAALVHRYRPPATVRLVMSDEPPASDYLNRVVVVRADESDAAASATASSGGTLEVTDEGYLLVAAPASVLSSTAYALADQSLELVSVPILRSVTGTPDWSPASTTATLASLGAPPISLSGVGRVQALVGIGQPAFGRPVSGLAINLVGVVTDLPAGATGRIDFLWNDVLVESRDMTNDTAVDVDLALSDDQLRRDNVLTIQLSYVPPSGSCTPPPLPARLDIDPRLSTVTPTFGDSLPPGFERFPQVLGSTVPVVLATSGTTASRLEQAGDLVAGLAAATPEQLATRIMTLDAFLAEEVAGIVVGADGPLTQDLAAPFAVGSVVEVTDTSAPFTAELRGPLALGQAYDDGTRDLVLLGPLPSAPDDPGTAAALALTDAFAEQVATGPLRWSALAGRVMVMTSSGQLEAVPLPPPSDGLVSAVSLLTIALIVTLLIVACLIVWSWNKPKEPAPTVPGAAITD